MDTTFRTKSESITETAPEAIKTDLSSKDEGIDVPFTDYAKANNHPYSVDYFNLGDNWEVFSDEVGTIESFIKGKIENGDIANTKKAVEKEIKNIEKLNNIKDEERSVVRVGILSEYLKFITNTRNIKRYAN